MNRVLWRCLRHPYATETSFTFGFCLSLTCGALYYSKNERTNNSDSLQATLAGSSYQTEDTLFRVSPGVQRGVLDLAWVNFDGSPVLSRAQADVLALWQSVPHKHPQLEKPRVTLQQDTLSIQFGLGESLDAMRFLMEVAQSLTQHSELQYTIKDAEIKLSMGGSGVCSVMKFNCVHDVSLLTVQIRLPFGMDDHPELEVLKKGSLSDDDLAVLRILFQSMSTAISNPSVDKYVQSWIQSEPEDDPFEEMERRLRSFMESFPFGDLHSGFELRTNPPDSHQPQIQRPTDKESTQDAQGASEGLIQKLETMGAIVYRPNPTEKLEWGILSGYEAQKRRIEDGLLLPLLHPDVAESIAKRTRKHYSSNRPRGILFEGPPGTGKTTSARLIASQAAVHLIYLPLESILSKWYGESEKLLSEAFKLAEQLGGSIIFFDEIETLGSKRNDEMHEASRRLLSVLLREMDGFDLKKRIIVIGATNRKQDVDAALLSRFDASIVFDLPDENCRAMIFKQYAQQLTENEATSLAAETTDMSGRDIRDICESTERSWASSIVRGENAKGELPGLTQYLQAVSERHRTRQNV